MVESYAAPHHCEIFSDTSLTFGAAPLTPWPSNAPAMLPPIHEPWPFQSVFSGPPNLAAMSASPRPGDLPVNGFRKNVLQIGGFSLTVRSTTLEIRGASSLCVKSSPVSAPPTWTPPE